MRFDRRAQAHPHHHSQRAATACPRRFRPTAGRPLTLDNVRGPWRPSGAVAGAGVFAIVWTTRCGSFWAPLHDFTAVDQLQLIEACRREDQRAGFLDAWPDGRTD